MIDAVDRRNYRSPGYGRPPFPTHSRAGSNSDRQSVGLPGHCERCAEIGHVTAHPNLGCSDVGCDSPHGPDYPEDPPVTGDPPLTGAEATIDEGRALLAEALHYVPDTDTDLRRRATAWLDQTEGSP